MKLPLDTTIYAPGLQKTQSPGRLMIINDIRQKRDESVIDKISNFVENIHMENDIRKQQDEPAPSTIDGRRDSARDKASRLILEAEKFRASLDPLKGESEMPKNRFQGIRQNENDELLEDDEFFYITCHVDPNLKFKIQRGEFVELEKLLTRDRMKRRNEDKLEFFHRDGHTYLAPADNSFKISNVRRWEQTFRVYAAIYSQANPNRAAEIWQYVYVINHAAANFIWENVSFYDVTFRQMMSLNPRRSWAKTYVQIWNIAMTDPIQRNQPQNNFGNSTSKYHGNDKKSKKRQKTSACWKFNHNAACNESLCDFEHKCSYCNGRSHSVLDCNKL